MIDFPSLTMSFENSSFWTVGLEEPKSFPKILKILTVGAPSPEGPAGTSAAMERHLGSVLDKLGGRCHRKKPFPFLRLAYNEKGPS
jgi:hypothetical protein